MPVCPEELCAPRSADPIDPMGAPHPRFGGEAVRVSTPGARLAFIAARSLGQRSPRATTSLRAGLAGLAAFAGLAGLAALMGCDTPDERSASWGYVHTAILQPACATASCHSKASSAAGLDLSTPKAAYSILLGRACTGPEHPEDAPGNYVWPYQPERSKLLYLLRGDRSTIMPPDSRLPASEIAIVERWVLEGARCD
jgi:hypothetical protein